MDKTIELRPTLLELAERCQAARGPDRELDVAIGLTGKFYVAEPRYPGAEPMIGYVDEDGSRVEPGNGAEDSLVPRYTASLDAAMQLVPEGWDWSTGTDGEGGGHSFLMHGPSKRETICDTATPALALCAAALRARASQVLP